MDRKLILAVVLAAALTAVIGYYAAAAAAGDRPAAPWTPLYPYHPTPRTPEQPPLPPAPGPEAPRPHVPPADRLREAALRQLWAAYRELITAKRLKSETQVNDTAINKLLALAERAYIEARSLYEKGDYPASIAWAHIAKEAAHEYIRLVVLEYRAAGEQLPPPPPR